MRNITHKVNIYNKDLKKVACLKNAFDISYDLRMNQAAIAEFSLPAIDENNKFCVGGNYVEIYDNNKRIDLFRIVNPQKTWDESNDYIAYSCEHVINTLLDDVLFGIHNVDSTNNTFSVIEYVLNQQTTKHWQLDMCDYDKNYDYVFENTNLKNALFMIPTQFGDNYIWQTDTASQPWKVSLKKLDNTAEARIYYKSNLKSIEREVDYTNIYNRVYALGSGDGVNQLTIESINEGNKKYVEDLESIEKYGVKQYIFTDKSCKDVNSLYALSLNFLDKHKEPSVTYKVSAYDLSSITGKPWDEFVVGKMVLIKNYDMLNPIKARIKRVSKKKFSEKLWDVNLELGNFVESIVSTNNSIIKQITKDQTISQGATNLCIINETDNVDKDHPLKIKLYIPETVINVNDCFLCIQPEKFRAYSKGTKDGGQFVDSTAEGYIETLSSTTPRSVTNGFTGSNGGEGSHYHTYSVLSHVHYVSIPNHSHELQIPDHTHEQDFGIFESDNNPTQFSISVNGGSKKNLSNLNKIDLMNMLSGPNEPITRGWHTIEIYSATLGRIAATLVLQTYIYSTGKYVK